MFVFDAILAGLGVLENVATTTLIATLIYAICNGWKYIFRAISFFLDTQLVKLIGVIYSYFKQLLNGTMFEENFLQDLMRNIYVLVGVIVFFRLMMVVLKYLVNPDLISDAKAGANALVKRVIIGSCGIIFLPTIFTLMLDLQVAILEDNLVQQIIIPKAMLEPLQKIEEKGGAYIGTYVLAGFISPNSNASKSEIKEYNLGVEEGDLANVEINDGGFFTKKFK